MSIFPLRPLEDVCTSINSGGTPSRREPRYWNGGTIPWIKTGELNDWKVIQIEEHITQEGLNESSAKLYDPGTILIAMYGDGRTITTMGIVARRSATNQACCALVADPSLCDQLYLFYALKERRRGLLNLVVAGAQRNLSVGIVKRFPVPIPPLETQRRIAAILGAYDDLIEVNHRRVAVQEEMARGLFDEWFVRFRFPGHESVAMQDTPEGFFPEDWRLSTLGKEFSVVLGGTPARKVPSYWGGNVPWLNSGKANELRIISPSEYITSEGLRRSSAKMMPKGATVIAITGATLGQLSILTRPMCGNQSLVGVWDEGGRRNEYVYRFIQANINKMIAHASGGAQQHINKEIVERFGFYEPPSDLMDKFLRIVDPVGCLIDQLLASNAKLAASRDLLIPRLISGQLSLEAAERELENVG